MQISLIFTRLSVQAGIKSGLPMKANELIQVIFYFGLLIALAPVLGRYMARIFAGERTFMHPLLGWVERASYKLTRVNPAEEMTWLHYFWAVLIFNLVGI